MKESTIFQHYPIHSEDRRGRLLEYIDSNENELRFNIEGCVSISNLVDILDTLEIPTDHIITAHRQIADFIFTGGGIADGYPVYKGDPEKLNGVKFQTTRGTGKIPITGVRLDSQLMRTQIVNKLDQDFVQELLKAERQAIYFVLPNPSVIITPLHAIGNSHFKYDPVIPYVSTAMNKLTQNFEIMSNRYRTAQADASLNVLSDYDLVRSSLTELANQQTQSP